VLFFPQQKFRKNISTSYICPNGKWVKPVPSSFIIPIYVSAQKFNLFEEQQELKESVRRLKTSKKHWHWPNKIHFQQIKLKSIKIN